MKCILTLCEPNRACGWPVGHSLKFGIELMLEKMNAVAFLGPTCEIAVEIVDSACSPVDAPQEFVRMLEENNRRQTKVFGIVGCGCTGSSKAVSPLADIFRIPVVSGSAAQPALADRLSFPYFWRTTTPINTWRPVLMVMTQGWGWTKVGAAWGFTANFKGIWDDFKNNAREMNVLMALARNRETVLGGLGVCANHLKCM